MHARTTTHRSLVRVALSATLFAMAAAALAEPIITIDEDSFGLPDEAFFAANPNAVVNVESGGLIVPGELADPFDFSGATVNLKPGGAAGFLFQNRSFFDNVRLNVAGGKLDDGSTFAGATGETQVTIESGTARGRLSMQGDSRLTVSGGTVGGGQPQGAPALIATDNARVTVSGGDVGHGVDVSDDAVLAMTSGSLGDFTVLNDNAVASITGGVTGRLLTLNDNATLNINGGTIGRELQVLGAGVVNMNGGGLERDAGILSIATGVINLRGGAVAEGFRAYGGKVNVMGGVIGDFFRLGAPGAPSKGNAEIFATSATLDGLEITGSREITEREGQFLSADLVLDGTIGLTLSPLGVDRIQNAAKLTLTLVSEPGDFNGDGSFDAADYTVWRNNEGAEVPLFTLGDADGSGVVDDADYLIWAANYGGSLAGMPATAVPEPAAWLLAAAVMTLAAPRRSRRVC